MSLAVDGFLEKDSVVGPEEAPKQDATAGHDARGETEEAVEQIRNCTNRQSADDAALAFCYLNSKGARRRLVRSRLKFIYNAFNTCVHIFSANLASNSAKPIHT